MYCNKANTFFFNYSVVVLYLINNFIINTFLNLTKKFTVKNKN